MTISPSLPRIEEHRVSVTFMCPNCRTHVRGTAYDLRETIRVANRVPRWGWQSHWVRCSQCKSELQSNRAAEDLQGVAPSEVNECVKAYVSFPRRFLAIASLLLAWTPLVGIILAGMTTVLNVHSRGWPRWISPVALVLAVVLNLLVFYYFLYMPPEPAITAQVTGF